MISHTGKIHGIFYLAAACSTALVLSQEQLVALVSNQDAIITGATGKAVAVRGGEVIQADEDFELGTEFAKADADEASITQVDGKEAGQNSCSVGNNILVYGSFPAAVTRHHSTSACCYSTTALHLSCNWNTAAITTSK